MLWVYIRSPLMSCFQLIPTTCVFIKKTENCTCVFVSSDGIGYEIAPPSFPDACRGFGVPGHVGHLLPGVCWMGT